MRPTHEELIAKGLKCKRIKANLFFYVSAVKKSFPNATFHEVDVREIEVNSKPIKMILLSNVTF